MTSIEVCPKCGGEVRVHEHADEQNRVIMSGICYHCGRLLAFSPQKYEEPIDLERDGIRRGWVLRFHDEDRGWLTRSYTNDEEALLNRHIEQLECHLTPYTLEEVRA